MFNEIALFFLNDFKNVDFNMSEDEVVKQPLNYCTFFSNFRALLFMVKRNRGHNLPLQ